MQRSSETIGPIAAALAKAQAELTNPEKALIATIRASNPGEKDQTFRYAALSSGLDIVRRALGSHEIATVQTTAIDKEAGLIRLTTMLAHSSGEWLSSEWPVCPISEIGTPRRMGAALTYARRYALFTLVGIAGEDDLDAPGLKAKVDFVGQMDASAQSNVVMVISGNPPSAPDGAPPIGVASSRKEPILRPCRINLAPEQSAVLRDQLIADLALIESEDEAADWAHKNLPAKNTLAAEDAGAVEASFREKLATLKVAFAVDEEPSIDASGPSGEKRVPIASGSGGEPFVGSMNAATPSPVALSAMPRPRRRVAAKAIRLRDKEHCKFVTTQACVVCGRKPSEAHHIRFAQPRALGRKVSDDYTVPVCRLHHRELHRYGDEASWWAGVSIDPLPIALDLWRRSSPIQN
jgi:hypothetical protein